MASRTPAEKERIVCKAYRAGSSMRTIADTYALKRSTVAAILERYGIDLRSRDQTNWSKFEVDYIIEHYNRDMTAERIGFALRRGRNSIIGKAHRLGLSEPINGSEVAGRDNQLTQEMRI